MSIEQKVPTIKTSKIRKSDINIGTCLLILFRLDNIHIGTRNVDKTTKGKEIPSRPIWYDMLEKGTHWNFSTNWNSFKFLSKLNNMNRDRIKVIRLDHNATILAFLEPCSSSEHVNRITKAAKSGRNVTKDKIGRSSNISIYQSPLKAMLIKQQDQLTLRMHNDKYNLIA